MRERSNPARGRMAFTLIELLVVISIIALLLAILMPALSKVKEMAKTLHCETNLKTLMTAVITYSVDNDSKLPGSWNYNAMGWGNPWDWAWAPWNPGSSNGVSDYMNATLEARHEGIKRGALYPYVEAVDSYHCVSDDSYGKNFRSYSLPDSINGLWGSTWSIMIKATQIRRTSSKYVFLEENDPRGYNINAWVIHGDMGNKVYQEGQPVKWADPLTVWHSGKSNFGFMDGHAETRKWSKETEELFTQADETGSWSFWGRSPAAGSEEEEDLKWLIKAWPSEK